ncbi:site-specific DNA-methyltransferase (cytosine-N4-specific) [Dehalogenimonas formicexedens]|uniref:Methyltransferase n=1 Tax=Dehalogenimonas formicexedens TaxID=1839801 RepID=A0A1P8F5I6_9CHLR|nr:site-specific DNA-methyltransferase [Dehalogenimonas formicexedens]APV43733.1 site-specific DNA-methyltransferase (cytosine-N4-specific) [Dehalogenimonas formicexedens]
MTSRLFPQIEIVKPFYSTDFGEAWYGDAKSLLKLLPDNSVDLVITSPPYALLHKKSYGNEDGETYVRWFRPFAKEIFRILKNEGSFILNIGGFWNEGVPTKSLYQYKLLLDLCEPVTKSQKRARFNLAQEFFWFNPAKMPNPVQWVNVERVRVKEAVEHIWWFSKTDRPKANTKNILTPYSESMKKLIKRGTYNFGSRPSGWNVGKTWNIDNGGAIPPNFLPVELADQPTNAIIESNTSSNDEFRRKCREAGESLHPACFPPYIPAFFIKLLTDENDLVVDPFSGSNTTGRIAEDLKRKWISVESCEQYMRASKLRWFDNEDT